MNFTICVNLLLFVFLLIAYVLVSLKLSQQRRDLIAAFWHGERLQDKLDGAKIEIEDLELTLLEASDEIDILNAEAEMEGPDM